VRIRRLGAPAKVAILSPVGVPTQAEGLARSSQVFYFVGVPLVQFLNRLLSVKAFLRRDAQRTLGAV
jgi:hypothetical protein